MIGGSAVDRSLYSDHTEISTSLEWRLWKMLHDNSYYKSTFCLTTATFLQNSSTRLELYNLYRQNHLRHPNAVWKHSCFH